MPLVGAGFAGYLFSPAVLADARLLQVGIGSLLLFGLATLFGLPDDPVLAHITLFGLLSAVFTLGSGPYSLDAWLTTNSPRAERGTMSADPAGR